MDDIETSIRERAHRIWEERGRPEGRAEEHWEEARRQIEAERSAPQNPAAGNPLREEEPDPEDVPVIAADAAANAAITGVPMAAGARRRNRRS